MKDQMARRDFLKVGTTAALASALGDGTARGEPAEASTQKYEAEVPDTLNLAERGGFAVNALTGSADPDYGYETYLGAHFDHEPPYMSHHFCGSCMQKAVHALPMMRVMSGSTQNGDIDRKIMEAITRDIESDGMWWLKTKGCPWRAETCKQDLVDIAASGRFMVALADWNRYDNDPRWLSMLDHMGLTLARIAIQQGDQAFYNNSYLRSGWPASRESSPYENPAIYVNGLALRGLTAWYIASGDKQALKIAQQVARYMQNPALGTQGPESKREVGGEMVPSSITGTWKPSEGPTMVAASERAHWQGHFHSHTMGMVGLIEYANQTNDVQAKRFVADFYEYARNFGIARMGFFPAVVLPLDRLYLEQASGVVKGMPDEGCAVADMTLLAILLSDGGVGDYWDDVDQYVRNQLIEHQVLNRDLLEAIAASGPEHKLDRRMETDDHVIDRQLGAFISIADPTMSYAWWTMCCLGNCSVAMYKTWESILRFKDGVAQVNLLWNRASAAMDVDSYLPYEGKVVLKNKVARKAYVRVPTWADKSAVRCRVNERQLTRHWLNNYLIVEGMAPKDVVTIEFPIVETNEEHTEPAYQQRYVCRFRGNTLMDIDPRAARPIRLHDISDDGSVFAVNKGYPLYLRDSYKGNRAPMKKVQQYISATII